MFRPLRTLFLIGFAFLGGVLFERYNASVTCLEAGGSWDAATCYGLEPTNG